MMSNDDMYETSWWLVCLIDGITSDVRIVLYSGCPYNIVFFFFLPSRSPLCPLW